MAWVVVLVTSRVVSEAGSSKAQNSRTHWWLTVETVVVASLEKL